MQQAVDVPIYSLDDALAALRAASASGTAVRLRFPLAAASSFGPDTLCQIIRQVQSRLPGVAFDWLAECGDEAGLALAMLRAGVPRLCFDGPEPIRRSLNDIARQHSAAIEPPLPSPDAATLAFRRAGAPLSSTEGRRGKAVDESADGDGRVAVAPCIPPIKTRMG